MVLKLKTAPTTEPVTLEEVKQHCRIDAAEDDLYLTSLIQTAREYVELLCGPLLTQVWEQYEDNFPCGNRLELGQPRLLTGLGIDSPVLTYTDLDGVTATLAAASYNLDTVNAYKPALVLKYNYTWPSVTLLNVNPIKITFTCGYGGNAASVPVNLRHALLLLCAHWYEERQPVNVSISGNSVVPVPLTVDALLANYRVW